MTSIHSCVAACVAGYAVYRVVSEDVIPHPLCQLLISGVVRKVFPKLVVVSEAAEQAVQDYIVSEDDDSFESLVPTVENGGACMSRKTRNRVAKAAVSFARKKLPFMTTPDNRANRLVVNAIVVKELERLHVRNHDIVRVAQLATTLFFIPTSFDQEIMDMENTTAANKAIELVCAERSTTMWSRLVPSWLKNSQRGRVPKGQ